MGGGKPSAGRLNRGFTPVPRGQHNDLTDLSFRDRGFVSCLQGVSAVFCITSA